MALRSGSEFVFQVILKVLYKAEVKARRTPGRVSDIVHGAFID